MTLDMLARSEAPAGVAVGTLARREARRMVRHPAYLLMLSYFLVLGGAEAADVGLPSRTTVHEILTMIALMYFGVTTFFAANLVASSARRAHAESQLAAAPTTAQSRTLATCLGVLGPTAVAAAVATAIWIVQTAGETLPRAMAPAELATIPLCTLGAGLLGVATARWLPWPGAPLIVLIAVIAWVFAVAEKDTVWWTTPWTMSPNFYDTVGLHAGSQWWHAAYLLGLSLLAGLAALLRYPSHRRPLLVLAAVLWIGTLAACWAQLP